MRNFQRLKNNIVEKTIFTILNYRMQGINMVNRENVTSVEQQDIPINFVNGVLVYVYKVFLIIGHLEMKTWTRGYLFDYDENKKEFIRFGPELVVLKSLNNSINPGKAFFEEVIVN